MPLTEIGFSDQAEQGDSGSTKPNKLAVAAGASGTAGLWFTNLVNFDAPACADGTRPILHPGTLPAEANAPGSKFPGADWKRWDGLLNGDFTPHLGVDDGILENCIANFGPLIYPSVAPWTNGRMCVYVALDGKYYVASQNEGDATNYIANVKNRLSVSSEIARPYDTCPGA